MNISHVAASRSRSFESRAFSSERVSHATDDEKNPRSSSPSYAWKFAFYDRIWSAKGPRSLQAKGLLTTLIRHADPDGQTWPGIKLLLEETGIRTERTFQKTINELVSGGWLRVVPQTWTSLTKIQTAAGKRAPRRGDVGQATNLYIVLDGQGREVGSCASHRPGLARTSKNAPDDEKTRLQNHMGGQQQNHMGEPPANLHPDPDQRGSISKEESVERAARVDPGTHISSKTSKKTEENLDGWNVLVEAHAEKTKSVYGLPPLPPDLKRNDQQALTGLFDGAVAEVRAKVHGRTGIERDIAEVRRELAARVMNLYFKRDNDHLRRVKHALRDLPREFHARITEAMQQFLRESHDAAPPRRPQLEQPPERVESADKPRENPPQKQPEKPKERLESADKPLDDASSMNTAREARRLLEALNASPQQELFRPSRNEPPAPPQPKRPVFPEKTQPKAEQARASVDKPAQDKPAPKLTSRKSFEQQKFDDKPSPTSQPTPRVERPLGRGGAPRWGVIGPRPTKVRSAQKQERRVRKKRVPDEAESKKEHGGGSTPLR